MFREPVLGSTSPKELARHAPRKRFAPDELRGACHEAGEELGWEDASKGRFRTAAQITAVPEEGLE
jgi:hypothetical protein